MFACFALLPLLGQTDATLDDLVRACEHIEIGRIESSRPIEGLDGPRIATVRVERSIWTADCADTFDVLVSDPASAGQRSAVEGDLAIWFLANSPFSRDFDSSARLELYRIRREHGLEVPIARLALERTGQQTRVVLPWPESVLPEDVRESARSCGVFETWLWRRILADTPRIESWTEGLTLGPDGHGSFSKNGYTEGLVLVPSALRSILGTIERENFYALPRKIGSSPGPDSNGWALSVRSWLGCHEVLVAGSPDPRSAEEVAAYARAMRIRQALPHSMHGSSRRD